MYKIFEITYYTFILSFNAICFLLYEFTTCILYYMCVSVENTFIHWPLDMKSSPYNYDDIDIFMTPADL